MNCVTNEIIDNELQSYKKMLDNIWNYITKLPRFSQECDCKTKHKEDYDELDSFDTIDYSGDTPNVERWCLKCGGYRYLYE